MMNSIQTQQPAQSSTSRSAPPAHPGPAVAAASTPINSQDSNEVGLSEDAPGLPATANWGSKAAQERRASRSTNASNPSPMTANAVPAPPVVKPAKVEEPPKKKIKEKEKSAQASKSSTPQPQQQPQPQPEPQPQTEPIARPKKASIPGLDGLIKVVTSDSFRFVFSSAVLSEEEFKAIIDFPQLLDPHGGAKRRAMREKEKELAAQREAEAQAQVAALQQTQQQHQAPIESEDHEATAGGSLQLGGEPEETHQPSANHQNQHVIAPPGQQNVFGQNNSLAEDFSNLGLNTTRQLTQQQQQQLLLSNFKSGPQSASLLSQFQNSQPQQAHASTGNAPGHARHTSRFSFANDSASASASVQPVANQKLMSQQSSMMPKNASHFPQISQHQPLSGQYYTSGVQGPPPGLKTTPTPPVSGGGMFAQGHGFGTGGLGYGANASGRNNNDALYQDLLRNRNLDSGARVGDAGKRESMFPSFLAQHPTTSTPGPAPGLFPNLPYGPSPGAYQETGSQKSKKKGKKHRHANTSSSGGGVVDVPDPSILQARLHQGGGMVGQGLYGQGQGGFSSLNTYNNYGGAGRW